jgi:molecular chaperone HscA
MGRGRGDIDLSHSLPYRFVDSPGMVGIETCMGRKTPVEISAVSLTA